MSVTLREVQVQYGRTWREWHHTNVVQRQRRETGEAKVHLAVPDGSLVGQNDGLWVAGGTARVDDSDGE